MKISVIIPAYNEESQIAGVIEPMYKTGLYEIIVVDDGSRDKTSGVASGFEGVKVITFPKNRGKAAAIIEGIGAATGDIIALIDADLIGFTPDHLNLLTEPIIAGEVLVVIGIFKKGFENIRKILEEDFDNLINLEFKKYIDRKKDKLNRIFDPTFLAQISAKGLSGQRAMKSEIAKSLPKSFSRSRFGIEVLMNSHFKDNDIRIEIVKIEGVSQVIKETKRGIIDGFAHRLLMYAQLIFTVIKIRLGLKKRD